MKQLLGVILVGMALWYDYDHWKHMRGRDVIFVVLLVCVAWYLTFVP